MTRVLRIGSLVLLGTVIVLAIASRPAAPLRPGNEVPELKVAGWLNGSGPPEIKGKVVVLEVFATW